MLNICRGSIVYDILSIIKLPILNRTENIYLTTPLNDLF